MEDRAGTANPAPTYSQRLVSRLQWLLAEPYSLLPSYEARYEKLLGHAEDPDLDPLTAYALTMLLGKDSARGYADMPQTAELVFPSVNAVDMSSQFGWYYFAGTVRATSGRLYGILCMLFRYSLLPGELAAELGISERENQLVDLQLSIATEGGEFHQIEPTLSAGAAEVEPTSGGLGLRASGCAVASTAPGELFPIRVQAEGHDLGGDEPLELAVDLLLTSGRPYLLQGADGAEPLVAGVGTRYYSIPGLVLDPSASSASIGGEPLEIESGLFWFDHQWGLGMVPSGSPRQEVMRASANLHPTVFGWDFFVANVEKDGRPYSFTFNSIHDGKSLPYLKQTGPEPPPNMEAGLVGKYVDPFGVEFNVSGRLTVSAWKKTDHTPNPEKYPNNPTWVPHGWEFELTEPVVPEDLRRLRMVPICDSAQALFFANGAQYVEAATVVLDGASNEVGSGFSEATAYVDNLAGILGLAGIPVNEENLALFSEEKVGPALWAESLWCWLAHQKQFKALLACGSFPPAARPLECDGGEPDVEPEPHPESAEAAIASSWARGFKFLG